jgi:hypothetical protein
MACSPIDREAREQKMSLADRHALRQERAPALLGELHALLSAMRSSGTILPQSVAGKAINYTLKRWAELTRFLDHPVIEFIDQLGGKLDEAHRHRKAELVASRQQGSRPQDCRHLFRSGELPQTGPAHSQVSGRRAAGPRRPLHPGTHRPHTCKAYAAKLAKVA